MTEAEERSITAAEEALSEKHFRRDHSIPWPSWYRKGAQRAGDFVHLYAAQGLAEVNVTVPLSEVPTLLRYKETAEHLETAYSTIKSMKDAFRSKLIELDAAHEGATSIANSLAASHAETAKAVAERDALAKEVERLRRTLCDAADRFDAIACNTSHDISALAVSGRRNAEAALQGGGNVE